MARTKKIVLPQNGRNHVGQVVAAAIRARLFAFYYLWQCG